MLYPSVSAVPAELRATAGLYTFPGGCWVTPLNRVVDGAALLPLNWAATLQGNGSTTPGASSIATAVTKNGNLVELAVLSGHALTAGAPRSQVNFTHRRIPFGQRTVLSASFRLPADWNTASTDVLLLQGKDTEDTHLGESGRNPPVAFIAIGNQIQLHLRSDPLALSVGNVSANAVIAAPLPLASFFTVSAVFELGRGNGGFCEFWLDRTMIGRSNLPVGYNDLAGLGPNYALYCYNGLGGLAERRAVSKGMMVHTGAISVAEVCDAFDSHPST